ncbi:MAG: hypothetical protein IT164_16750 [Bryobacterales bacterium]|nr:hypothetical protein [Bryobacterales bacterium]
MKTNTNQEQPAISAASVGAVAARDSAHSENRSVSQSRHGRGSATRPLPVRWLWVAPTLVLAAAASAEIYKVKESGSGGHWNDYNTWKRYLGSGQWTDAGEGQFPGYQDTAYIPNGLSVWVAGADSENFFVTDEEVDHIYVCGDNETAGGVNLDTCRGSYAAGEVNFSGCSSLTLFADSVVNGKISFEAVADDCGGPGELRINRNSPTALVLKISGHGGVIRSAAHGGLIISDPDSQYEAQLRIDGDDPGDLAESMTILTNNNQDMEIAIALNNRGDVVAQSGDVYLTEHRKDGNSGHWRATQGTLYVNYEVRGGATWTVEENAPATILFNAECLRLSGDFHVKVGSLVASAMVCTTGHGYHGGPDSSGPVITANPPYKITFHGDCE